MKQLPRSDNSLVLRTDFTDDAAWTAVCEAIQAASDEGFRARVDCLSDRAYEGLTVAQLTALAPKGGPHAFAFLVDQVALRNPEHPILVVDLYTEPGRTFRVIPAWMWAVENNLSIANMDFGDFADHVDADGIYRGDPEE